MKKSSVNPVWLGHWGQWIKARAKALGLRLSFIAEQVGTTPRNCSKWINSKEMPSIHKRFRPKLAAVLRVEMDALPHVHHEADPRTEGNVAASILSQAAQRVASAFAKDGISIDELRAKSAELLGNKLTADEVIDGLAMYADSWQRAFLFDLCSQIRGDGLTKIVRFAIKVAAEQGGQFDVLGLKLVPDPKKNLKE